MRNFERVRDGAIKYNEFDIKLPVRATKNSAGYDFYSPIDIQIAPSTAEMLWTNVKAQCESDEFLMLCVTSGMGKNGIILSNAIGVVDSDYYSNEGNDGNIGFRLFNFGNAVYTIKKGDKIGQGIFLKFLKTESDNCTDKERVGGFGSTVK